MGIVLAALLRPAFLELRLELKGSNRNAELQDSGVNPVNVVRLKRVVCGIGKSICMACSVIQFRFYLARCCRSLLFFR